MVLWTHLYPNWSVSRDNHQRKWPLLTVPIKTKPSLVQLMSWFLDSDKPKQFMTNHKTTIFCCLNKMSTIFQKTFQMHFLCWKCLYHIKNFTEIYSKGCNWQYPIIGSGNGLLPDGTKTLLQPMLTCQLHSFRLNFVGNSIMFIFSIKFYWKFNHFIKKCIWNDYLQIVACLLMPWQILQIEIS